MDVLEFSRYLGDLKDVERTGWVRTKIVHPESVADHSFRTAVLAMVLAPQYGADQLKSMKMALIHDIGESIIGDIVTVKGAKVHEKLLKSKNIKERKAIKKIMSLVDTEDFLVLFDEFEANKTPEARLVKQIDRLELAFQAYEYEKKHNMDLEEFFETVRAQVKDEPMLTILGEIEKVRPKSKASGKKAKKDEFACPL